MSRASWWYSWYTSSQLNHIMPSPRRKSSSVNFVPCMNWQFAITSMWPLHLSWKRRHDLRGGTSLLPSSYFHGTTELLEFMLPPTIWAVVIFDVLKKEISSCCSLFSTTSDSSDCFSGLWAVEHQGRQSWFPLLQWLGNQAVLVWRRNEFLLICFANSNEKFQIS